MNKIFTLTSILCCSNPVIAPTLTKNIDNSININNNDETNQVIYTNTHQLEAYHGSGWDCNVTGLRKKDVAFKQTTKRVFFPKNVNYVRAHEFIKELTQQTTASNSDNTGSYRWGDANYDTELRIQDWKYPYLDNLGIDPNTVETDWGKTKVNLYLNNTNTWPKGENFHGIKGKVVFQNGSDQGYEYQSAKDFNLHIGVHKDFVNKSFSYYGIPYSKLKEVQYVYVFDNFVRRYLWTLHGEETTNSTSLVKYATDDEMTANVYNIKDLVSINTSSYENGTISIGLNQEFLDFSKKLNTSINAFDNSDIFKKTNKVTEHILELYQNSKVDENIIDAYKQNDWKTIAEVDEWANKNPCSYASLVEKYKINAKSNPFSCINELLPFISLTINYQTPSLTNPEVYQNNEIRISNQEFKDGFKIKLNKNKDDKYEFKLTNLICNQYEDINNYVCEDSTKSLSINDQNIVNNDNSYILKEPKYIDINFNSEDSSYISKHYAEDLSDKEVLDKFVLIADSYHENLPGSLLPSSSYQVTRSETNGEINLKINLNGQTFTKKIYGFKKPNFTNLKFDANKYSEKIFMDYLDQQTISAIMQKNGFDPNVSNQCSYSIYKRDEKTGKAYMNVVEAQDNDVYEKLKDKKIEIDNCSKYYIEQNNNLSSKYLSMKPSDVSEDLFKSAFINTSNEFLTLNKLKINLTPGNNTLKANIQYNDYLTKQDVKLEYSYTFKKSTKWNNLWLLAIVGIGLLLFVVGMYFYRRDNLKK